MTTYLSIKKNPGLGTDYKWEQERTAAKHDATKRRNGFIYGTRIKEDKNG